MTVAPDFVVGGSEGEFDFRAIDPLKLAREYWPKDRWTREQQEIVYSVWDNDETDVVAANGMGKDYIAGRIVVLFVTTRNPVRVITTSAKEQHLNVLWGEINSAIDSCAFPLRVEQGGPLRVTDLEITKWHKKQKCPLSYVMGMVASEATEAALGGHWVADIGDGIPRTMFLGDEASSVPHRYYRIARPWARRRFFFGNAWPCDNFFRFAFEGEPGTEDKGGDIPRIGGAGYYRKTFRLAAETSPNVQLALREQSLGLEPSAELVVPGVKSWSLYQEDRATLKPEDACVILDAEWYKGKEVRLYPAQWITHSETLANLLKATRSRKRTAKAGGCDPGEGAANTALVAVDEFGVIERRSTKTPNTDDVYKEALEFLLDHQIPPENFLFDRGGGGKQHADYLRRDGYPVRTIAFGEAVAALPQRMRPHIRERVDIKEERYTFINRRAQLYGDLAEAIDPDGWWFWPLLTIPTYEQTAEDRVTGGRYMSGFAIPDWYPEFRHQMEPIPKRRDGEGRLFLPPKHKKDPNDKQITLVDLIGHSPDELDALVLALHGLIHPIRRQLVTAA